MNEELVVFQRTHTWDIILMLSGANSISCKQIYKIKTKFDGSVERYKTCLITGGFVQEYGIDYEETFSPMTKMTSNRTLIALVAAR